MRSKSKFGVLCSYDVANCLCFRRCCGSCAKHLDHCKIAGGFGCKQRRVPRNRRDIGGFVVCQDRYALHGLPQARSDRMDSGGYSVRLFDLYSDGSVVYLVNRLKRRICV